MKLNGIPTWVYWTAALLALVYAIGASFVYLPDTPEEFTYLVAVRIWGGPVVCLLVATVLTLLRRF
jgi:hypothetical protein